MRSITEYSLGVAYISNALLRRLATMRIRFSSSPLADPTSESGSVAGTWDVASPAGTDPDGVLPVLLARDEMPLLLTPAELRVVPVVPPVPASAPPWKPVPIVAVPAPGAVLPGAVDDVTLRGVKARCSRFSRSALWPCCT